MSVFGDDGFMAARPRSTRGRWTVLALAWIAQATGAAVFLGLPAIGPQLADAYGLGLGALAAHLAALAIGGGLGVIAWGSLADRIGGARVIAIGLALAAASLALLSLNTGLPAIALFALAGAGSASANAGGGRSVLGRFGAAERGLAMGIRHTALPVGAALAALLLPAIAARSSTASAVGAAALLCALVAVGVPLWLGRGGDVSDGTPTPSPDAPNDVRLRGVIAASALLAVPQLGLSSFLVVFLHRDLGWSAADAAVLLAVVQLTGAAARPLAGLLSDRRGDRLGVIAAIAGAAAATLVALAVAASAGGMAIVCAAVAAGVATHAWNGVAAVAAGEAARAERAGAALGWHTSAVFLGGAVAAPMVAAVAEASSWRAAFAALAVPAILAASVLWRARPAQPRTVDELLARSLNTMSSSISLMDRDGRLIHVNAAFERLTGYSAAQAIGRPWTCVEGPETDPATAAELRTAMAAGRESRVRVRHHRQDGRPYWSETFLSPVLDEHGTVGHFIAVQKDVTERTEAERRAAHLAYHDALTGLANRTQVQEQLALALARARRSDSSFGLLFLDLDGFKAANDRHGHDAGDQLLKAIADRWRAVSREGDVLARYGGDEFVVLLSDLDPADPRAAAVAAAERYMAAAHDTLCMPAGAQTPIPLSVSVGIAVYPADGLTASDLLVAADAAMYEAKRGGGSALVAGAVTS